MSVITYLSSRGLLGGCPVRVREPDARTTRSSPCCSRRGVHARRTRPAATRCWCTRERPAASSGAPGAVSTGGAGTGGGLGNQGAVFLSQNEKWLLAVNAGSDSISAFAVDRDGLRLTDVVPSGGVRPVSITEHHGIVYVLNAGSDTITGFTLDRDGRLAPLAALDARVGGVGTAPAQVGFSPDWRPARLSRQRPPTRS